MRSYGTFLGYKILLAMHTRVVRGKRKVTCVEGKKMQYLFVIILFAQGEHPTT